MFRGNASKLRFRLEDGLKVIISGAITLYTPRGSYQINCFNIEPVGSGNLALAFEQLKKKLGSMGYFDQSIKKRLPRVPKKVAIITSKTGAALQDMLRVANSRWPLVEFYLYDVLVQGDMASTAIAKAIKRADIQGFDAIVVGRGGGSIEDLWAFNEEIVAKAIFEASTPIISAVGHEIDVVISDLVADVRAATPSNAMEILLPDKNELLIYLDETKNRYDEAINRVLIKKSEELNFLFRSYKQHSYKNKIEHYEKEIVFIKEKFLSEISFKIKTKESEVGELFGRIERSIS